MPIIGEFETAVKAADPDREPDQFKLNGAVFTIADEMNIVAWGLYARAAREGVDSNDMEGLATLIDTVGSLVVPEDEERFLQHARKTRVGGDLLMKIIQSVMEAQGGRPMEQPSDSSDGLSTTGAPSKVLSSSPEPSAPSWRNSPFGQRELAAVPELYADISTVAENGRTLVG